MDRHLADQPGRALSALDAAVVVPTRDRLERLERCLAALRASGRGEESAELELIVADDGSREGAAVESAARRHRARVIRLSGAGPAAARNAGAAASSRPVILLCDDDCEPTATWAGRMLARLGAGAEVVAGRTASPRHAGPALRAAQAITSSLLLGSLDTSRGSLGFAPSCNLGVRRDVLESVRFDESFPSAAGEDRDWCERVREAGHAIAYEPRAVVLHRPALDAPRFLRQQWGYGRGAVRYRRAGTGRGGAGRAFWEELRRAALAEGPGVAALLGAAQVATAAGAAAEVIKSS